MELCKLSEIGYQQHAQLNKIAILNRRGNNEIVSNWRSEIHSAHHLIVVVAVSSLYQDHSVSVVFSMCVCVCECIRSIKTQVCDDPSST